MSVDATFTDGVHIDEAAWTSANNSLTRSAPFIASGFELTDGGSLNLTVGDGFAVVNGLEVNITTNTTVALADDDQSWIWLGPDGVLTDELSGTDPGNALLLGSVVTASGSISSITAARDLGVDPDGTRNASKNTVFIAKPSDTARTSTTTAANDPHLLFTSVSGEAWDITWVLWIAQAAATAGFKFNISGGNGAKMFFGMADGSDIESLHETASSDYVIEQVASSVWPIYISSMIVATGTTISLQWAQGVSHGSATTVKAKSWLTARKITQ